MNIGVLCPSEIALRRFMPALKEMNEFCFKGVGVANEDEYDGLYSSTILNSELEKAKMFVEKYGGSIYNSYISMIEDSNIDAIYIPLPPGLHYKWAKAAIENGKHVLVEKPATTDISLTRELINNAKIKNVAIHENYMFIFHNQINEIQKIIDQGILGDIRLFTIKFGFPQRNLFDFRYNKHLGGGALFDAGGYVLKYAAYLLGGDVKLLASKMNYTDKFDVDLYGSGYLINKDNIVAMISFGMDNDYKCELEIWGSKATLTTGRVFTAPVGFKPILKINRNGNVETIELSEDDTFKKSLIYFFNCIQSPQIREESYLNIEKQAKLVEDFYNTSKFE